MSTVSGGSEESGALLSYFSYTGAPSVNMTVEIVVEFFRKKP